MTPKKPTVLDAEEHAAWLAILCACIASLPQSDQSVTGNEEYILDSQLAARTLRRASIFFDAWRAKFGVGQ